MKRHSPSASAVRAESSPVSCGRLPDVRRFALFALFLVFLPLLASCASVSSDGTVPRNGVRAPRSAHRLTVSKEMLFEYGENPLEKKTVTIPEGEYVFEAEDDIFLYFRAPEPLEYRVHHKEGYAEGFFQMGGIALSNNDNWDKVEYPVCTYTDGEEPRQKRLTCPLEPSFLMQKRGSDWSSDFDVE